MNCFPRVRVKHTSKHVRGQVYIPTVNFLLMAGCTAVVLLFQSSGKIGNAYGGLYVRKPTCKPFVGQLWEVESGQPCLLPPPVSFARRKAECSVSRGIAAGPSTVTWRVL